MNLKNLISFYCLSLANLSTAESIGGSLAYPPSRQYLACRDECGHAEVNPANERILDLLAKRQGPYPVSECKLDIFRNWWRAGLRKVDGNLTPYSQGMTIKKLVDYTKDFRGSSILGDCKEGRGRGKEGITSFLVEQGQDIQNDKDFYNSVDAILNNEEVCSGGHFPYRQLIETNFLTVFSKLGVRKRYYQEADYVKNQLNKDLTIPKERLAAYPPTICSYGHLDGKDNTCKKAPGPADNTCPETHYEPEMYFAFKSEASFAKFKFLNLYLTKNGIYQIKFFSQLTNNVYNEPVCTVNKTEMELITPKDDNVKNSGLRYGKFKCPNLLRQHLKECSASENTSKDLQRVLITTAVFEKEENENEQHVMFSCSDVHVDSFEIFDDEFFDMLFDMFDPMHYV